MADNEQPKAQLEGLATLLVLNQEIRKLSTMNEFTFFVVNESFRLVPYKIAYLWYLNNWGGVELLGQSGAVEIDKSSYVSELLVKRIQLQLKDQIKEMQGFTWDESTSEYLADQHFKFPPHALWCPFINKDKKITGGLIFFRDNEFNDSEKKMLHWLIASYQYSWQILSKPSKFQYTQKLKEKPYVVSAAIIALAVIFFPIKISVLANAIVTPKSPILINAPMTGVIKSFEINPGDKVDKGQTLFTMDKTELSADYEINKRDYQLTETKLRTAINKQLETDDQNADVPILESQLEIQKEKLNYTGAVLNKADVKSPIAGIAIFDNKNDWIGQPVQTGERILTVADPKQVQLKIYLPVTNYISLNVGGKGIFFLYGQFASIPVVITSLGYNAKLLPNKILAYELYADIENDNMPQLGGQGTVRLYGHYVPLIYYIFRRPIYALRQTFGI